MHYIKRSCPQVLKKSDSEIFSKFFRKAPCLLFECVKRPMPAHQVSHLTWYIFETRFSMSARSGLEYGSIRTRKSMSRHWNFKTQQLYNIKMSPPHMCSLFNIFKTAKNLLESLLKSFLNFRRFSLSFSRNLFSRS